MPKNKNAVIRYMFLDQLLSDQKHRYTCLDLVIRCNEMLLRAGYPPICEGNARGKEDVSSMNSNDYKSGKRLIQMDLQALQDSPFNMEIDSSEKLYGAPVYRYKDPTRTLFSKQLSDDEKRLLHEVLNTLGAFSGVESFSWLHDLRERLDDERAFGNSSLIANNDETSSKPIISFEENKYLKNKEYLSKLFSFISIRKTIIVRYRKFFESKAKEFEVYPYLLKQYSNRWYLICTPTVNEKGKYDPSLVLNLALDRMEGEIVAAPESHVFKDCIPNLEERYEDIIGVSFYTENPLETIVFAVKPSAIPFIETKPIHESQRICLDSAYSYSGHKIYCIDCRYNHELLSTFSSFGDEIVVLSDCRLKKELHKRAKNLLTDYDALAARE